MSSLRCHDTLFRYVLETLRCPSCRQSLQFEAIDQGLAHAREYGVLTCECSQYPVIDGIAVLMNGSIGAFEHTEGTVDFAGTSKDELVRLVLAKQGFEALLRCITFPLTFRRFERLGPTAVWQSRLVRELLRGLRRLQLQRWCDRGPEKHTAREWFQVFFGKHSPVTGDMYNYFFYRLGQQHHLASLALLDYLPESEKPILDLACGSGHLEHNLSECSAQHSVVGVDRNFFQLWLAQYAVAPKSCFLCADVDLPLPFADNSFSATLCADAFHYFHRKRFVLDEIKRCAPDRPILLTGVGNKSVEPNEGCELTGEEYLTLDGAPEWCLFGETELLEAYLKHEALNFAAPHPKNAAKSEKWLCIVYPGAPAVMTQHENTTWLHSAGRLGLNPLYEVGRSADGRHWKLTFKFPSDHFAFENAYMTTFCPQNVTLSNEAYFAVRANSRSPEVDRLIEQMVVIGLPRNYVQLEVS
jgi:SAM-dependent methyltransferase/uncharacterized protein YbaR (Trm112 family)